MAAAVRNCSGVGLSMQSRTAKCEWVAGRVGPFRDRALLRRKYWHSMGAKLNTLWIGKSLGYVEEACLASAVAVGHQVVLYIRRSAVERPCLSDSGQKNQRSQSKDLRQQEPRTRVAVAIRDDHPCRTSSSRLTISRS